MKSRASSGLMNILSQLWTCCFTKNGPLFSFGLDPRPLSSTIYRLRVTTIWWCRLGTWAECSEIFGRFPKMRRPNKNESKFCKRLSTRWQIGLKVRMGNFTGEIAQMRLTLELIRCCIAWSIQNACRQYFKCATIPTLNSGLNLWNAFVQHGSIFDAKSINSLKQPQPFQFNQ